MMWGQAAEELIKIQRESW